MAGGDHGQARSASQTFLTALRLYDGSCLHASIETWRLRGGDREVLASVRRFSPRMADMMAETECGAVA